jgi:hypothetical protein
MQRPSPPSERGSPGPESGTPDSSPGPEFHPTNPPPFTLPTPAVSPDKPVRRRNNLREVYLSDRNWNEFQRIRQVVRTRGLVGSAGRGEPKGRAGGRPPLSDTAFDELLEAYRWKQRVCARAAAPRKVDESALRALRIFYAPHPFSWLAPFPPLDRMVVQTFPSYRPPRRLHVIAGFCENGLLRPTWRDGDEWIIDDSTPPPTRIPEYLYLRGNLGYRPLDQEAAPVRFSGGAT